MRRWPWTSTLIGRRATTRPTVRDCRTSSLPAFKLSTLVYPDRRCSTWAPGPGTFARGFALRGCTVTGLDVADGLVERAAQMDAEAGVSIEYVVAPAEATGLPDDSFDVVGAATAWHWFKKGDVEREIRRLLRRDGRLVLVWFSWMPLPGNVVETTERLIVAHNPAVVAGRQPGHLPGSGQGPGGPQALPTSRRSRSIRTCRTPTRLGEAGSGRVRESGPACRPTASHASTATFAISWSVTSRRTLFECCTGPSPSSAARRRRGGESMATLVVTPIREEFDCLARVFERRWGSPERRAVGAGPRARVPGSGRHPGSRRPGQGPVRRDHRPPPRPSAAGRSGGLRRRGRVAGGPCAHRRRRGRHGHGGARLQPEVHRRTAAFVRRFTADTSPRCGSMAGDLQASFRRALRAGRQRRRSNRRCGPGGCAPRPYRRARGRVGGRRGSEGCCVLGRPLRRGAGHL